jgi:UDP-N-acetylglucosamine--N-acetylmuramyl-(pentapeptide) pyrophosphoryl-undecaprenol N-acetylglucosamine transferase
MKIVFTGGGSGGHIFPILAIVREIKKEIPQETKNFKLYYIGPDDKYGLELLRQEGVRVKKVICGKLRRYFSLQNFLDLLKMPLGFFQSLFWLFFLAPDLVFSKGGYGSFPVAVAADILSIPIFLHESDVEPGFASRVESKWVQEIFISFKQTAFFPKDKKIVVGNPIRKEILGGSAEKAKEIFGLQGGKPLILILGGSQGAQKINETVLEILPEFLRSFEIIHQIGEKNFSQIKNEAESILFDEKLKKFYHPFTFLNETLLKHALAVSELVISRAGAGSIFEVAVCAKPIILIPLAWAAQDHQRKNAYAFAENGGGEVIEEMNFSPHFLLSKLKHLFSRPDILKNMSEKSRDFARPAAAKIIASYLVAYLVGIKQNGKH